MPISAFLDRVRGFLERRAARTAPLDSAAALAVFLRTRAAHVAQTSLYGYLRTRAGSRYPELFDDDPFIELMNIAKWHIWLACLGDLAVYAGAVLQHSGGFPAARVGAVVLGAVDDALRETGLPPEAGPEYSAHAARVRSRIALTDWNSVAADETAFAESPDALVRWAPMIEEFKKLDESIVRNSIRFRWNEVRRDFRDLAVPVAILGRAPAAHEENAGSGAP